MRFLRAWGVSLGMLAMLIAITFAALSTAAPSEAEAGCVTTTVCSRSGRYSSCRETRTCSAPRVRRCSFVNRCTPQRTCTTRYGVTHCVTRDVCRRFEICS